jgi:hypothetical protein
MLKQRIKSKEGGVSGHTAQQIVQEMPLIKNNLYKLDAWVQPFADVKTLH